MSYLATPVTDQLEKKDDGWDACNFYFFGEGQIRADG